MYDDQLKSIEFHDTKPAGPKGYQFGKLFPVEGNKIWQSLSSGLPYQLFTGGIESEVFDSLGIPPEASAAVESILVLNLSFKGRSQGMLVFESSTQDSFDTPTVNFLHQLGSQLATVIMNSRLLDHQRRRSEQFALINKLATKVLETISVETILDEAGESVLSHFGFDNALIFLSDDDTGDLYLMSANGKSAMGVKPGIRIPSGEGLVGRAALSGETQISRDCRTDKRFMNPGTEFAAGSEIAVPIKISGKVLGVLDIENEKPAAFAESDLAVLETVGAQIATALTNAHNYENLKENSAQLESYKRRIADDLDLAGSIMKNLLPSNFVHPRVELSYVYHPHSGIGGDFIKVAARGNWVYMIVGDLSGHGIGAAIVMVGVVGEIENAILNGLPPSEVVKRLNAFILRNFGFLGIYLSIFCARLNTLDGTLEHINAGHSPAIIQLPDAKPQKLPSTNAPLGLFGDDFSAAMEEEKLALPPKSRIVLFTDGIVDERDGNYTEKELLEDVSKYAYLRICDLAGRINERSLESMSQARTSDDRLVAALEYRERTEIYERFSTLDEIDKVMKKVVVLSKAHGYTDDEQMFLRLSSYEMMVNSLKHGHNFDSALNAEIEAVLGPESWQVSIRDRGSGFDYSKISSQVSEEEFILKTSGRGISLTQRLVDKLEFSDRGRCVTLSRAIKPA